MVKCVERKSESLDKRYISKERVLIISAILAKFDGFVKQILTNCLSYIIINEE
jgi:hypothetical protein